MTRPALSAHRDGAAEILELIRTDRAHTRADVAALTGWGRAAIAQRLDELAASGLVRPAGEARSTGGRPAARFEFNSDAGIVPCAEIGPSHARIAVTDLRGRVRIAESADLDAGAEPATVLELVSDRMARLLDETGSGELFGVGVGLAAPVEFAVGRPVKPPIMPGWDGFEAAAWLRDRWGVAALVDNEVNMIAIGEHRVSWPTTDELLAVKVSDGIGCGIVAGGHIQRGAQGTAGDLGHVRVPGHDDVVCRCGNTGCLEAVAGAEAIAARLSAAGLRARSGRDVVALAAQGRREAIREVRQAGRLIGEALAGAVNMLNPAVIVLGGDLAAAEDHLFAGVREVVYSRSPPLATRQLQIVAGELSDDAAVVGAALTVVESVLGSGHRAVGHPSN